MFGPFNQIAIRSKLMRIFSAVIMLAFLFVSNCASGYTMDRGSLFQSYTLNKDVSSSTDLGT